MTDHQWKTLKQIIDGKVLEPLPVGFVIDSPWLPNWYGITLLDYFSNDGLWLNANLKALDDFRDVIFLPGFWSEFGMCTEPSAFGARCSFPANEFPHALSIIRTADEIDGLPIPDPKTDGLLPFMINRLKIARPDIEKAGHKIRFAVCRGPLNIAGYLMGITEFLTTLITEPQKSHVLLSKISDFLERWLNLQREVFPTIDGIFLLDDIIGFLGKQQFLEFGLPYFKKLFPADVSVKFLHNDAPCRVSAPYLAEMGVNLFNMGIDVSLNELKAATQNKVALLGNLPPRDVLAAGSSLEIRNKTFELLASLDDKSRIILSCAGGMPPGVSSENLHAFIEAARK